MGGLPRGTSVNGWGMGSRTRFTLWTRERGTSLSRAALLPSTAVTRVTVVKIWGRTVLVHRLNKLGPSVSIPSPRFDEGLQSRVGEGEITPVRGKECLWWVEVTMGDTEEDV